MITGDCRDDVVWVLRVAHLHEQQHDPKRKAPAEEVVQVHQP